MKLYIDPTGGIAGDMVISALVSLGADKFRVLEAVQKAIDVLGKGDAEFTETEDSSTRILLRTEPAHSHLGSIKGEKILYELFSELNIKGEYAQLGIRVLDILSSSEMKAHELFDIDMGHHHHGEEQAWLHEAQDIIIDITGTVAALQNLNAGTEAILTSEVSVGGGTVECSHGVLNVPPPAVEVILKDYSIEWKKGPIEKELCTPTGAALLAALTERGTEIEKLPEEVKAKGCARGSGDFPIPPLKFYMI